MEEEPSLAVIEQKILLLYKQYDSQTGECLSDRNLIQDWVNDLQFPKDQLVKGLYSLVDKEMLIREGGHSGNDLFCLTEKGFKAM